MRYELNIKIEFHEEKELKIIYDEFVKIIEDNFEKEEKNLNNIIKKIINEKDNTKYYQNFIIKFNEFFSFLTETTKKYSIKISKSYKEIIEKYSIKSINKDEYLVSISYKSLFTSKAPLGGQISLIGYSSFIGSLCTISSEISIFMGLGIGFLGGILLVGLGGFLTYGIVKYFHNLKRKEKILQQFKTYFDKLNSVKKKILTKMESFYKETINNIRNYKISQKEPLINIYNNNIEFEKIQNEFINICNEIENNN